MNGATTLVTTFLKVFNYSIKSSVSRYLEMSNLTVCVTKNINPPIMANELSTVWVAGYIKIPCLARTK